MVEPVPAQLEFYKKIETNYQVLFNAIDIQIILNWLTWNRTIWNIGSTKKKTRLIKISKVSLDITLFLGSWNSLKFNCSEKPEHIFLCFIPAHSPTYKVRFKKPTFFQLINLHLELPLVFKCVNKLDLISSSFSRSASNYISIFHSRFLCRDVVPLFGTSATTIIFIMRQAHNINSTKQDMTFKNFARVWNWMKGQ